MGIFEPLFESTRSMAGKKWGLSNHPLEKRHYKTPLWKRGTTKTPFGKGGRGDFSGK
jgi:hypothetical protein